MGLPIAIFNLLGGQFIKTDIGGFNHDAKLPSASSTLPLGSGQGAVYEGTACERRAGAGIMIHLRSTKAQAVCLDESLPLEHAFPIKLAQAGN